MGTENNQAIWEVVLRVDSSDVAIATSFMAGDGKQDVVLGVTERELAGQYATLIEYAAHLIRTSKYIEDWDAIHARGTSEDETSSLPF